MSEENLNTDITAIAYRLHKNYIMNHATELKTIMQSASKQEIMDKITELKRQLKRPILNIAHYVKTEEAAAYLNVDPSFLTKRRGKAFKLGKHFFKPSGESIVRWDLTALDEWITDNINIDTLHIDEELASLLERS